jgi:hypothetical protein
MDLLLLVFINLVLFLIGIVVLLLGLEAFISYRQSDKNGKQPYSTIAIKVPRENETGPIVAEQIFSALHGITKELSFIDKLKGKHQETISFEIANVERNIKFFIHFPTKLRNVVEGQIYAQYPLAEIDEVEDYVKIDMQNAMGAELGLLRADIYPIKRYQQFEDKKAKYPVDPLSSITSTLSKFNDSKEQAWIQIVVRPLGDKWRKIFTNCVKIIGGGIYMNIGSLQNIYTKAYCTRSRVIRIIFFPLYLIFFLQGFKLGGKEFDNKVEEHSSRGHDNETPIMAAMDKVGRIFYETTIRIVYVPRSDNKEVAEIKVREIAGSFKQFNLPHFNGFEIRSIIKGKDALTRYKKREIVDSFVLNAEELATVYHLPNITVSTPNIYWVRSRRIEPPNDLPTPDACEEEITLIGKTNFRGSSETFGIKPIDRRRHLYIIGKTGMGKSTLLENMLFNDIQSGKGVAVIDPHGDLADSILGFVPANRTNDVILFDPSDRDYPLAFNMLENIDPSLNSIVCSGLVGIFKKIYADSWGPRLEHILRNTILSLLEYPNSSILGISRMLQDKTFRQRVVKKVSDPVVKNFWLEEFEKMEPRQRVEAISPILNKVGQFLSSPIIRNILGQVKSTIDLRFAMDKKKIIIVNLSKGKIGEDNSALLGAMLITKFQLDAMSRANIPEKEREDFYLYVDEFQNFATESFATILSEARKYKLNLTMANQYIAQMPEEVRDAVFGNVGSMLSFQVGFDDADYLTNQYGEEVMPNDLVSLSKYNAYMRLLIDGMPSKTFSLTTLPPPDYQMEEGRRDKIIKLSRERYATERTIVEEKIRRWSQPIILSENEKINKK